MESGSPATRGDDELPSPQPKSFQDTFRCDGCGAKVLFAGFAPYLLHVLHVAHCSVVRLCRGTLDACQFYDPWNQDENGQLIACALRRVNLSHLAPKLQACGIANTKDLVEKFDVESVRAAGVKQQAELHQLQSFVDAFKLGLIGGVKYQWPPHVRRGKHAGMGPLFDEVDVITPCDIEELQLQKRRSAEMVRCLAEGFAVGSMRW